jgi:hypothetical protein
MNKYFRYLGVLVWSLIASNLSFAHHSNAPHFDSSKPISIEGVITEFKFVNPHAWVYLDVTDATGQVANWNCEMGAASSLQRQGWTKQTFPVGASIKIEGNAARRDPVGCSFQSGILPDGTTIARGGQITRGEQVLTQTVEIESENDVDLTSMAGNWITVRRDFGGGAGFARSGDAVEIYGDLLTEAGKMAVAGYDDRFDDPALQCSPSSIIRGYSEPSGASDVTITDEQIVIRHEFMDTVRTIDLTTRTHPANIEPSMTGHSVGWYEGDALVVETVGFEAGVLLPHPGLMHSDEMKIVEKFSLADGGTVLLREYEVTDPKYLTRAYTGNNAWGRSDIPVRPYNCVELGGISNIKPE